jgi:hypothetical protein
VRHPCALFVINVTYFYPFGFYKNPAILAGVLFDWWKTIGVGFGRTAIPTHFTHIRICFTGATTVRIRQRTIKALDYLLLWF